MGPAEPARPQCSTRPDLVRQLHIYREKVRALAEMGFGFEPCTRSDVLSASLDLQEKYGLLTNDSVVIAVALRVRADALVTADRAFEKVTEIEVCSPADPRL